jgi:hypothetical protein
MLQGVPTLYNNGVTNAAPGSFGALVPMPWPPQYYTFFNDFDRFNGAATGVFDWLVTGTGSAVPVVGDAFGGVITITTGATEDNATNIQWHGCNAGTDIAETFTFVPGKELWFGTRFQLADVLQCDLAIGLAVAGATAVSIADGVWFGKLDGSAVLTLNSAIATPLTASANIATLVAATWYEFGFHYNGVDAIKAYQGGGEAGTWNYVGQVGISALPTTELAVTMALQTGETGAKTALVDWLFASRER